MKRNRVTALLLASALLLVSCSAPKPLTMSLSPAELTRNEEDLLDFVGAKDQVHIFDYTFDKNIQSITTEVLTQNAQGEWEGAGGLTSTSHLNNEKPEKDGRLMILLKEDGAIRFAHRRNNGESTWSNESAQDSLAGKGSKYAEWLLDATGIVPNQPIPLAMFGRSESNKFRTSSLVDYLDTERLSDYDAVSVITVCFSTEPLQEPAK